MLDFYYPVRNPVVCIAGDGGKGGGGAFPGVQYRGDDSVLCKPVCLYVPAAVFQTGKTADDSCAARRDFHARRDRIPEYLGDVFAGGSFGMYVADVPDDLRDCAGRYGR